MIVDDLHVVYRVYVDEARARRFRRRPRLQTVHAVRGISLIARSGDVIGVVGRNGAGKTTLMQAIAGLLPPTQGRVYARGEPCLLGVGAALMKDLTGARNIVLGCLAMGMSSAELADRYAEIVEFSGLGDFIDMPMRTYSTGMVQRLRFAIATAAEHDVVLIDEALATGDARFQRRSAARLAELRERATTVFLVSHSLDAITESCNRAIWLENGRIRMDGPPEAVAAAYADGEQER